jgi:hypothetical protein
LLLISAATFSPSATLLQAMMTLAPALARASLVTAPMPLAPPVTMAVLPERSALVALRTSKAVEHGPREVMEGSEGDSQDMARERERGKKERRRIESGKEKD